MAVRSSDNKLANAAIWVGNFLLPIAVMLIACIAVGIYPFGPMSFLIDDGQFQYVDFFAWYQKVLIGEGNPFYCGAQALGTNVAGQNSYYLASPFNFLILLFGEDHLSEFALTACALKAGCIQLAMLFFLRRRFGLNPTWATALALGFTMSMWTITQMRNPMWMDGLIFLPLVAWGTCCLIQHGRWRLFAVSLAAAIITCWYMGYMIVLFLIIYWFFEEYVLAVAEGTAPGGKVQIRRFLLFVGAMMLALALSAFIFAPTVCAMLDAGSAASGGSSSLTMLQDTLQNRLPESVSAASVIHVVLVAAGLIALVIVATFIGVKRYSARRKAAVILLALLVLCLAACIAVPQLQHGSFTDVLAGLFVGWWVDSKTPQLYANIAVLVGAIAFFVMRRIPLKLKLAAGLLMLLLIESSWLRPWEFIWGGFRIPYGYHSRMSFVAIFMLVWLAAFATRAACQTSSKSDLSGKNRRWLRSAVIAFVFMEAAVRTIFVWSGFYINAQQADYDEYMGAAEQQISELQQTDPGIYRIEKTYTRMNMPAYNEAMSLGYRSMASYSSTTDGSTQDFLSALGYGDDSFYTYDLEPTLLGESLLGVKYISADQQPFGFEPTELGAAPNGARFYRNPYALSLAYCVSPDVLGLTADAVKGTTNRYDALNAFANALIGEDVPPFRSSGESYTLDMDAFHELIDGADGLAKHQVTFNAFEDGYISGTFTAPQDCLLLVTIPNQRGWKVELNGRSVETLDVAGGALMAIPTDSGENHLVMRFIPPGLYVGCAASALAVIFIVLFSSVRQFKFSGRQFGTRKKS